MDPTNAPDLNLADTEPLELPLHLDLGRAIEHLADHGFLAIIDELKEGP